MEPNYMNGNGVAKIGHVVMSPGNVRGVVVGIRESFVIIHSFGYKKNTGELVLLNWNDELPASECSLLQEQAPEGILEKIQN